MLRTTNWKHFETQSTRIVSKHHKKASKLPEHRTFENKHKIRFIQVLDRFICLMSKRVNEWKTKENQAKRSPPFCPKCLKTSWDETWKEKAAIPYLLTTLNGNRARTRYTSKSEKLLVERSINGEWLFEKVLASFTPPPLPSALYK